MPEYQTDHAEMYLCTSVLLPDEPLKLIGVEPLSKQEVVHHMLLFGEFQTLCKCRYIAVGLPNASSATLLLLASPHMEVIALGGTTSFPHMPSAGCAQPAAPDRVWDCHTHSVCAEAGSHVLYGWAKGAEAMHLPAGVGFRVGQGTGSRHLVLQVHGFSHLRCVSLLSAPASA